MDNSQVEREPAMPRHQPMSRGIHVRAANSAKNKA